MPISFADFKEVAPALAEDKNATYEIDITLDLKEIAISMPIVEGYINNVIKLITEIETYTYFNIEYIYKKNLFVNLQNFKKNIQSIESLAEKNAPVNDILECINDLLSCINNLKNDYPAKEFDAIAVKYDELQTIYQTQQETEDSILALQLQNIDLNNTDLNTNPEEKMLHEIKNESESRNNAMALKADRYGLNYMTIDDDGDCLYSAIAQGINAINGKKNAANTILANLLVIQTLNKVDLSKFKDNKEHQKRVQEAIISTEKEIYKYTLTTNKTAQNVRNELAAYISANKNNQFFKDFQNIITDELLQMQTPKAWGGALAITAASQCYGVNIVILHSNDNAPTFTNFNVEGETIFLGYEYAQNAGVHYSLLLENEQKSRAQINNFHSLLNGIATAFDPQTANLANNLSNNSSKNPSSFFQSLSPKDYNLDELLDNDELSSSEYQQHNP